MTQIAVQDYFPKKYPVFVNSIEVDNGESIVTYPLIKQLEKQYPKNDFYFIIGSDLLPGLVKWDNGQEFIDEVGFVLFERKGHESKMDPDGEFKFTMPKNIKIIDKARTQVGQISSTEIRKRITDARKKIIENLDKNVDTNGIDTCESPQPFYENYLQETTIEIQ